ncbi:hypothetical protein SAMN02745206_03687 [Desulfacinum infernum DSM 9756]|jgi:hypothetical protein|uniref:Uncharacterized protein n=1 Tax=Desulfacinum infernum DSM 9756 TaxID=1121391 RepID=A0A1M5IXL0_9BACT|nr:hypothetical protein [Desulfacinum infernum]SHG32680.1 hypothetical protein SAMN02745206_03687 [Desulfacinum infernum DSM 9756]
MTVTERLTGDWAARKASGVLFPTYFEEWTGCNERVLAESRRRAAPWVDFVLPLRERDMSCRITEIIFPGTAEAFVPRTPLGKRLVDLRRKAIQAGMKLLTEDEVLEEVRRRRGELEDDEADVY